MDIELQSNAKNVPRENVVSTLLHAVKHCPFFKYFPWGACLCMQLSILDPISFWHFWIILINIIQFLHLLCVICCSFFLFIDYNGVVDPADTVASDTTDTDSGSHGISPLGIVIATACSVLGVLLLVMVVMVFRRRKPRPRLLTSSQTPPPYSRVHSNSIDEHDQVFLIGYDGSRPPTLPTYEEAVSHPGYHHHQLRRSSGGHQDYRPLPSIPTNLRNNMHHFSPDTNNRLSSVTAGSMTRDGISEAFGSIDTVNVSISDASTCTSVTVETYESGSSHPSNTSGRATAGSLGSLSGNLVTEGRYTSNM